jgi:hypothetical protein
MRAPPILTISGNNEDTTRPLDEGHGIDLRGCGCPNKDLVTQDYIESSLVRSASTSSKLEDADTRST